MALVRVEPITFARPNEVMPFDSAICRALSTSFVSPDWLTAINLAVSLAMEVSNTVLLVRSTSVLRS